MNKSQIKSILLNVFSKAKLTNILLNYEAIVAGGAIRDLLIRDGDMDAINDVPMNKLFKGDIDIFLPVKLDDVLSEKPEDAPEDWKPEVLRTYDDPFDVIEKHIEMLEEQANKDIPDDEKEPKFLVIFKNELQMQVWIGEDYPTLNFIRTRDLMGQSPKGKNDSESLGKLLDRFDLTCCQCGVRFSRLMIPMQGPITMMDLQMIPTSIEDIYCEKAQLTFFAMNKNSFITNLARLFKYKAKGFEVKEMNFAMLKARAAEDNITLTSCLKMDKRTSDGDFYMQNSRTFKDFFENYADDTYYEIINDICFG